MYLFLETAAPHARHDQVRALGICPAVRPHRGTAGLPRRRIPHGWSRRGSSVWIVVAMVGARSAAMAFNRLGCRYRRAQSAAPDARICRPGCCRAVSLGVSRPSRHCYSSGCGRPRMPLCLMLAPVALAHRFLLFVHQAFHALLAPGIRLLSRYRAGGGVDRRPRFAGRRESCG